MPDIFPFLSKLSSLNSLDYLILAINLLMLLFARHLVMALYHADKLSNAAIRKVRIIRALSLLVFIGYFFFSHEDRQHGVAFQLLGVLGIIYLAFLLSQLASYVILRHYGRERDIEGKRRFAETYHTRLLSILTSVFIAIIALITIVQLVGLSSSLETKGALGFVGVFFALTISIWAPDIFSGLIILNSNMLEEGDIIELHDNEPIYAAVYKTKVFHTVLLNLVDNHRIMIRNSRLRDFTVHNLSKFSSAKGLRDSLAFKIGYDVSASNVRTMLNEAYEKICQDNSIGIDCKRPLEVGLQEVGDHAIEWRVYYYTKQVERLPAIRQQMLEVFWETAIAHDISLSTPLTHVVHQPDLLQSSAALP